MSEGQEIKQDKVKATKKRERSKGAAKPKKVVRADVVGKQFVCTETKQLCDRAIIFEDKPYANVTVAAYALRERPDALAKLAEETEQSAENLPQCPNPAQLMANGGNKNFAEWLGELASWDRVTEKYGYTPREWAAAQKKPKKKAKDSKIVFERGVHLVGKRIAKLTEGVVTEIAAATAEAPAKSKISDDITAAKSKLNKFVGDAKVYGHHAVHDKRFAADVCIANGIEAATTAPEELAKQHNKTASALAGIPCYGPALFFFTQKVSHKIE